MKKEIPLAAKVRNMTKGSHFMVVTLAEREHALRVSRILKDAGVIDFNIATRRQAEGGYLIFAA